MSKKIKGGLYYEILNFTRGEKNQLFYLQKKNQNCLPKLVRKYRLVSAARLEATSKAYL